MHKFNKVFFLMALALILSPSAFANAVKIGEAHVQSLVGTAMYQKAGQSNWDALTDNVVLYEKDAVRTDRDSVLVLEFIGNAKTAEVTVRESTEFTLDTFRSLPEEGTDKTLLDVAKGSILIKAEKLQGNSTFEVKTPTTVAGIRGTIFEVNVD